MLRSLWKTTLAPLLRRPARFQVAALCYRLSGGVPEIVMITSRETGRWVLPKGWPKTGLGAGETAREEAWEEAGVTTTARPPLRIGRYRYDKRLKGGVPVATDVDVYAIEVKALADRFPEAAERRRAWMAPDEAAAAVDEPELAELFRTLPLGIMT
ncbi:8-oxo-dGTP pyrophosphatase MutT, NUDIX family [Rhodovulum sp. ES.010]|uniref:NUDIX hydrolase n=1 Tax=Rhodovulum sp. ES.010 TaxID=1882821 RepID=UPI00092AA2F8|nr:NUDIX hydrolase [Rhodovulum sp. ES.010]SIO53435.1 8-oxo-dGTP pyrophosphatase MutT, NUDIX family [Rhodovulum sp. ES.010]